MLWPKNSFGVVMCPCALAMFAVPATKTSGSRTPAARQERRPRVDIQNLRIDDRKQCSRRALSTIGRRAGGGQSFGSLAVGTTCRQREALRPSHAHGISAGEVRSAEYGWIELVTRIGRKLANVARNERVFGTAAPRARAHQINHW